MELVRGVVLETCLTEGALAPLVVEEVPVVEPVRVFAEMAGQAEGSACWGLVEKATPWAWGAGPSARSPTRGGK